MTCDRLSTAQQHYCGQEVIESSRTSSSKMLHSPILYIQLALLCHSNWIRISRFNQMKRGQNVWHASAKTFLSRNCHYHISLIFRTNMFRFHTPNANSSTQIYYKWKLEICLFVCVHAPHAYFSVHAFFVISPFNQSSPSRSFIIAISSQRHSVIFHNNGG